MNTARTPRFASLTLAALLTLTTLMAIDMRATGDAAAQAHFAQQVQTVAAARA